MVRNSEHLRKAFAENSSADFFSVAAESPGGREFLDRYTEFLERHGHRRPLRRDIYFPVA